MTATKAAAPDAKLAPPLVRPDGADEGTSWMTLGDVLALLGCSRADAELYYRVEREFADDHGPHWLPPTTCARVLTECGHPVTPRHLRNLEQRGFPCTGDGPSKKYPWPLVSNWMDVYRENLELPPRKRATFIHPLHAWRTVQQGYGARRAAEEAVYRERGERPHEGWRPDSRGNPQRHFTDPYLLRARKLAAEGRDVPAIVRELLDR